MNPNTLYLLKFFGFFIAVGIFLILVYLVQYKIKLWQKIKRTNENLYMMKYLWLQEAIHDYEVNRDNYAYIATQLLILYGMKYHNPEKSEVLTNEFNIRFARFKEDNQPCEFDPSSVFSEFNDV
jgi:hypothetical protein